MKLKLRLISVLSALCILGSIACFSAFAAELMNAPSGEDGAVTADPVEQPATDPIVADPAPATDPVVVDPAPATDPVTVDSGTYEPPVTSVAEDPVESYNPGTTTSAYEPDPGYSENPGETSAVSESTYSATYSDVISEGNFPQPVVSTYVDTPTVFIDNSEQYNQYIANTYQAQYDDNYIYVPEYEEPTESLISTPAKVIDTDELNNDDWHSIMLDLSAGNMDAGDGTMTFNFIKENNEEGDSDMMWLVYLGTILIIAAILMVIYVIVSTGKAKEKEYYYV